MSEILLAITPSIVAIASVTIWHVRRERMRDRETWARIQAVIEESE